MKKYYCHNGHLTDSFFCPVCSAGQSYLKEPADGNIKVGNPKSFSLLNLLTGGEYIPMNVKTGLDTNTQLTLIAAAAFLATGLIILGLSLKK